MSEDKKTLTTEAGRPVADNQNISTAGPHGPALMQDAWYMEKLAHFNRERIPERVVHAKGSGAFGTFTVTHDITPYTRASIFAEIGKKTDVFLRFSTVAGERGAADTERDVRGFAMKFYTDQGNWDLVGNNTPVFFIRDPLKFPDFIHTQKRDPKTNLRSATAAWDFWSLSPETLHQVMILMSDRGIPKNLRQMHGFGSHTFSFINKENKRFWVKFHPETFVFLVDKTKRMTAKPVHLTQIFGNTSIAHQNHHLMKSFGTKTPKIPCCRGTAQVRFRISFLRMNEIGKLERIANKKHRRVVAHQIPVALIGIKFHSKTPHISFRIGSSALTGNSRKS